MNRLATPAAQKAKWPLVRKPKPTPTQRPAWRARVIDDDVLALAQPEPETKAEKFAGVVKKAANGFFDFIEPVLKKVTFRPPSQGLMSCCGLAGLSGFPSIEGQELSMPSGYSNYLVVLNGRQRKCWHEELLSKGFKVLREGMYNSVHDSALTLYLWEACPERSPDNPEFWTQGKYELVREPNGYSYMFKKGQGTKKIRVTEEEFRKSLP